jgi:drug/metabolite transporter (DMT)-like permease
VPGNAVSKRVWIALLTVYLVWGSTFLAIAYAVETLPPFLMAGARFLVAGSVLLLWAAGRGDPSTDPVGWPQWRASALIGGLLLFGGNGLVSWSERRVPSGVAALVIAAVPLWMALFAAVRKEERVRGRVWVGIGLGFLGITVLVRSGGGGFGGSAYDPAGIVLLVTASLSWAFGSILALRVSLPRRAQMATAMEMLAGGAIMVLVGMAVGEVGDVDASRISAASVLGWAYLVVVGSFIGFGAYVWLLKNAPPTLVSTYAFVNPVVAFVLGWAIRDEPITLITVFAAALIVVAVALIVLRRGPTPASRYARTVVDTGVERTER